MVLREYLNGSSGLWAWTVETDYVEYTNVWTISSLGCPSSVYWGLEQPTPSTYIYTYIHAYALNILKEWSFTIVFLFKWQRNSHAMSLDQKLLHLHFNLDIYIQNKDNNNCFIDLRYLRQHALEPSHWTWGKHCNFPPMFHLTSATSWAHPLCPSHKGQDPLNSSPKHLEP